MRGGKALGFEEGGAGGGIGLPDFVETVLDIVKRRQEFLSACPADLLLEVEEGEGMGYDVVEILLHKQGVIVEDTETGDCHIAHFVVVRSVAAE